MGLKEFLFSGFGTCKELNIAKLSQACGGLDYVRTYHTYNHVWKGFMGNHKLHSISFNHFGFAARLTFPLTCKTYGTPWFPNTLWICQHYMLVYSTVFAK